MKRLICKLLGHKYEYRNRYYRCVRCGVRRCDVETKEKVNGDGNRLLGDSSGLFCSSGPVNTNPEN